ncbi:MAG: phosphomannomutase/phosphoglucomutase [Kiritimatiellae bacterium]|nr:phosphomannomutase/phosphoglucomutase [Kiritimatiellia bacterium]
MAGIFKAYDIRGVYGTEITEKTAFDLGRAFVTLLGCRKIAVGRDCRPSSEPLFAEFARGANLLGADVVDLGLCSTPISYYANAALKCDASVMITASHNPKQYNGFKLCRADAVPISGATGIADIEKIVADGAFAPEAAAPGKIVKADCTGDYCAKIRSFAALARPLRIVCDFANGMGTWEAHTFDGLPIEVKSLFAEPDGDFPNHEANPLKTETLAALQAEVRKGGYDFGVAFDGDADRAGFVDEKGDIIPMDIITALIAKDMLRTNPGATVFYDLRSSWSVKETIEESGGKPMMSRVGHAFIKQQMRENDAIFAGELSGHYYFKANSTAESSALAVLCIANIVSQSGKPLSSLIAPIRRYFASGEINTKLESREKAASVLAALRGRYGEKGRAFELDGLSVEFDTWWFNVRCSNTEPLIRLNVEAKTADEMEEKRDELLAVIRG